MWLDLGHIVPSAISYNYPVLFAENKGRGGLHLYVNYYSFNTNTVTEAWPLPHIDDLLSQLKGARVFSSLDLWYGYH